jgi:hypothetical protein
MDHNINIEGVPGMNELVIREGVAQKLIELQTASVGGNLQAPAAFYEAYKGLIHANDEDKTGLETIVTVNLLKLEIQLIIGWNHPHKRTITGKLLKDPEFDRLGVNSNNLVFKDDLLNKLKFCKRFFPKLSEYNDLIDKLKKFETLYSFKVAQHDDQKGNKKELLESAIQEINLPSEFKLVMPLTLGGERKEFIIDLNVELDGKYPKFWLESVDVYDMLMTEAEEQIKSSITTFNNDEKVAVIYL